MRILQVVHGFPPSTGGTELYTYNLSKELSKRNEVTVFYPVVDSRRRRYSLHKRVTDSIHAIELVKRKQGPFPSATALVNPQSTFFNRRLDPAFELVLGETQPEVVHFQHLLGLSASFIRLCNERRIPCIMTVHDFWLVCQQLFLLKADSSSCNGPHDADYSCFECQCDYLAGAVGSFVGLAADRFIQVLAKNVAERAFALLHGNDFFLKRNAYLKRCVAGLDVMITPSEYMRRQLSKYGFQDDKIVVSAHGIDVEAFHGFSKRTSEKLRFGFVAGALVHHKGVHVLLQAFNMVRHDNVELRIYGKYDRRSKYYKDLLNNVKNPNVHFMGGFSDVRVPYGEIDILVVPSICSESYSLVIQEAFVAGTPVIASDMGALPEFVEHNKTGLLFRSGDADDLYEKIQTLIDKPDLINQFQANIKAVKTIAEQAIELEGMYEKLRLGLHKECADSRASMNC